MAKKTIVTEYRVVITPTATGLIMPLKEGDYLTPREVQKKRAHEIEAAVKRHIDNVDQVYIDTEADVICEYCERDWESPPGCCNKAMDEYETAHPGCYDS